jgi:hypothetical protein
MAEYILEVVEGQPEISIRRLEGRLGTVPLSVLPALQERQLCPYNIQSVQKLVSRDEPARHELC